MSSTIEQRPHSRRRWLRFSLRSLLLLVMVVSCVFGWLGSKLRQAAEQREAVQQIQKLRGAVEYDYELDANRLRTQGSPRGPAWIRAILGTDFFHKVMRVHFGFTQVTDDKLAQFQCLHDLEWLDLFDTEITDQGLFELRGFAKLERLGLESTCITGEGLKHLEQLHQLHVLNLCGSDVTDEGLAHLEALTQLKELDLSDTKVGDAGLMQVAKLQNLQKLKLTGTLVTEPRFAHIHNLYNPMETHFTGALVTEAGVQQLQASLPNLKIYFIPGWRW